jgi:hypothetical protein
MCVYGNGREAGLESGEWGVFFTLSYLSRGISFVGFRFRDGDFTKYWSEAFGVVEKSD